MAAVICQSIGDLCRGCGEIMCLPCKACGIGCQSLWDIASSPFFPYMFVTFALNIAPVALGIQSVPDLGGSCADLATWMLVNGIFCFIHIVACLYIVHQVQDDKPSTPTGGGKTATTTTTVTSASVYDTQSKKETVTATATPVQNLESGTYYYRNMSPDDDTAPGNTWGRIKHVMCYDKGVALYIIIAIAWMIYQTIGVSKYVTQSGECGDTGTRMLGSVLCGWLYMSLVGFAFFCSMCCMRL